MARQALTTHKGRTFMTILGVVIGIGAIIIVMSVGSSASQLIVGEVETFGAKNVFVNPGKPSEGLSGFSSSFLIDTLRLRDIKSLENKYNVPDAVLVNPSVSGSASVAYESDTRYSTLLGSGAQVFNVYNLSVPQGRSFTQEEVDGVAQVAVLGKNVVKDLFGPQDPIGQKVKIKDTKFKVIGVFASNNSALFGIDDMVVIPYTTAQQKILGIRYFHEVVIQARSEAAVPIMVEDIKRTLRDNHDIDDPTKDDFIVSTQEDIIKSVQSVLGAITAFLALVAAISLVVGGVGIMNIMYVSVTERTREIGLRKALGATRKDILSQFLIEAVMVTGLGGIVGVIGGLILTAAIATVASYATGIQFPFVFSWQGALLGLVVSIGVGLLFGIFPARQAAKKSPIEALRYE